MRLIDADEANKAIEKICNDYGIAYGNNYGGFADKIASVIDNIPTVDAKPVEYQPMSKDFARMITKCIASLLSELQLDLPSIIYEDIESNLLKNKFTDVENFVQAYIKNNSGAKMDEVQE